MAATTFKLTLNLAKSAAHKSSSLLVFQGYQGTAALPAVWYKATPSSSSSSTSTLTWNNEYKGFISDTDLHANSSTNNSNTHKRIAMKKTFAMKAGESAHLDYEAQGLMTYSDPLESDDLSAYYLMNSSIVNVNAAGLVSRNPAGRDVPTMATSYLSNSLLEMKPLPSSVFLTFVADATAATTNNQVEEGDVMERAPSDGVLVKLEANSEATVSHDGVNWSVTGGSATIVQHSAKSDLRAILESV